MRRIALTLLAATAAIGVFGSAATAADLPRKAPAPVVAPPPPIWNWTGFYVGGHVGAGWSRNQFGSRFCGDGEGCFGGFGFFDNNTDTTLLGSHNGLGPLGGFQIGYNYQFANSPFVVGIEGEWSFADLKGDHQRSASFADTFVDCTSIFCITGFVHTLNSNFQESFSTKVKDIAAITGKLGIASGPQDRTLWYVKGGGAWAKTNIGETASISALHCDTNFIFDVALAPNCNSVNAFGASSGSRSRWGWTVGTGVEWGLWNNLSARIEYDYYNFGRHDVTLNGTAAGSESCCGDFSFNYQRTVSLKQEIHAVKVGLNYTFDWGRIRY